jgi:hypothetical protein
VHLLWKLAVAALVLMVVPMGQIAADTAQQMVTVATDPAQRRVDVTVNGTPFTSYIWPDSLRKPVLHPLLTASGTVVTRGFPPGRGERADHPHHVGLWFNYGDVNGFDFWNNSTEVAAERAAKMGTVLHEKVVSTRSGAGKGELSIEAVWRQGDSQDVLREQTTFVFHAAAGARMIDRVTTLTAIAGPVRFPDNKEGVLGLRVARALEDPAEKGGSFVDASGAETKLADMDATGVTGLYTSSEGKKSGAVWGTRGRWTMLTGKVQERPVTIAILDHPDNPGFPTYWHARGYGLFAANPLGQAVFSEGKRKLDFALPVQGRVTFRYRVVLLDAVATPAELEKLYQAWANGHDKSDSR